MPENNVSTPTLFGIAHVSINERELLSRLLPRDRTLVRGQCSATHNGGVRSWGSTAFSSFYFIKKKQKKVRTKNWLLFLGCMRAEVTGPAECDDVMEVVHVSIHWTVDFDLERALMRLLLEFTKQTKRIGMGVVDYFVTVLFTPLTFEFELFDWL